MEIKIKHTFAFWLIGIGVFALIVLLILFFWNESLSMTLQINDSKFSSFGAMVSGCVGAIWSLGGVILFYVALTEQRKDMATNSKALELQTEALKEQIKEFELQTEELQATRKVYNEQLATQSLQRFESTFFQMLTLHHGIVDAIMIRDLYSDKITTGRESFLVIVNRIKGNWNGIKNQGDSDIVDTYMSIYDANQHLLGHYFRNLYHIYKFVDLADTENKRFYTNLIRAQLSTFELLILVYDGISVNGSDKFKPLIEKYAVFKNLDWTLINGGFETIKKYKAKAFGHKDFSFLDRVGDWL